MRGKDTQDMSEKVKEIAVKEVLKHIGEGLLRIAIGSALLGCVLLAIFVCWKFPMVMWVGGGLLLSLGIGTMVRLAWSEKH